MRVSNILDPIQSQLDQTIFRGQTPRPTVVSFIERKFFETMGTLVSNPEFYFELVMTGSLTTYQYSESSDCDISVYAHYDELARVLDLPVDQVRRQLVTTVTTELDGTFVPGTTHPLQYFVVNPGDDVQARFKKGLRSGWSFEDKGWLNPPEKNRVHDISVEFPDMYQRAYDIATKMRILLDDGLIADAKDLYLQIHAKRSLDQEAGLGDFSEGNITYKFLLHEGLFDRLRDEAGVKIAKTAARPESGPSPGWVNWSCPNCDAAGYDDVYEDPEGGFECRKCGAPAQSVRTAKVQVLYDFERDKLILVHDHEPEVKDNIVVGTYESDDVHLHHTADEWINANYFKRLWINSFPEKKLNEVYVGGNHVETRPENFMTYTEKNPAVVSNPEVFKHAKDPWRKGRDWKDFIKNKGIIVDFQMGDDTDEKFEGRVKEIHKDKIRVEVAPGEFRTLDETLLKEIKFKVRDEKRSLSSVDPWVELPS